MKNTIPTSSEINDIKIIVCDLDGTLLNHNKQISDKTQKLLISLQKKGYTLALASGRFYYELQPYIKQLRMEDYQGIAICANGLEVHDLANNNLYCFEKLSKNEAIHIIDTAKKNGITCYLNYQNQYYTSLCTSHKIPVYFAKIILFPFKKLLKNNHLISGLYKLVLKNDLKKDIGELHKICFLSNQKKLKRFQNEVNQWHKPYVFYYVNQYAVEIMHNSVGKYEAIQYVCKQRNIELKNVIAFGDSGNDLNLIKHAGIGVAMKNAFSEVKEVANYQTFKTNQNDGIYDFLKHLNIVTDNIK